MSDRPTLLYRIGPSSGLGHVLVSILNCAMKARELGRDFAIDAGQFQYFSADRHRQFCACFAVEAPPDLRVITDPVDIAALNLLPDRREVLTQADLNRLAGATERLVVVPAVMLTNAYRLENKTIPPALRIGLRGWLRDRMAAMLADFAQGPPVIGLYFRHGNGEHLLGRLDTRIFANHAALLAELQQRYAALSRQIAADRGWGNARVFVASDNAEFVAEMKRLLPNAFSLAKQLPTEDYALHLRRKGHTRDILFEAVQDLFALSACRAMVFSDSLFAQAAALNSLTLDADAVLDVRAPKFQQMLDTLPPDQALELARAACAAAETMPTLQALASALRRSGDTSGAQALDRRIAWFHAAHFASKDMRAAQFHARDGRLAEAIAGVTEVIAQLGPNPYVLMFLAQLRRRAGELDVAESLMRQVAGLDDGVSGIAAELARLADARAETASRQTRSA